MSVEVSAHARAPHQWSGRLADGRLVRWRGNPASTLRVGIGRRLDLGHLDDCPDAIVGGASSAAHRTLNDGVVLTCTDKPSRDAAFT